MMLRNVLLGLGCLGIAVVVGYAIWAVFHVDLSGAAG